MHETTPFTLHGAILKKLVASLGGGCQRFMLHNKLTGEDFELLHVQQGRSKEEHLHCVGSFAKAG